MDALQAIVTRRSTRKYAEIMPERALIEQVIQAGRHAPSGGNNQTTHLIVFTDRKQLQELAALVQDEFSRMEITEGMFSASSVRPPAGRRNAAAGDSSR